MTDCSLVKQELMNVFDFTKEEIEKYDDLITYAVNCVNSLLKDEQEENDLRIVHLCSMRAYYQIELVNKDEISSFSAGDVSYSVDTSSFDKAKSLLDEALNSCRQMLNVELGFAFKAV